MGTAGAEVGGGESFAGVFSLDEAKDTPSETLARLSFLNPKNSF